eukprot:6016956-Pyramimonas_sp.AAC.1
MGHNGYGQPAGNRSALDTILAQFPWTQASLAHPCDLRLWSRLPGISSREIPSARAITKPERATNKESSKCKRD